MRPLERQDRAPEDRSAVHRRYAGDDRALAALFVSNAGSFLRGAHNCRDELPDLTRYNLAVAIELTLKAYLLHRGVSDDWNRIHIRHDLTKALRCARRAGFTAAPPGLATLAAVLGPYYETNAVPQMPDDLVASVDWAEAYVIVDDLLAIVDAAISVLKSRRFEHAGRRFEIRAETYSDPTYVEAVVFENGKPARVVFPGGLPAAPVVGASFHRPMGHDNGEAIDALIACAERALCVLLEPTSGAQQG